MEQIITYLLYYFPKLETQNNDRLSVQNSSAGYVQGCETLLVLEAVCPLRLSLALVSDLAF